MLEKLLVEPEHGAVDFDLPQDDSVTTMDVEQVEVTSDDAAVTEEQMPLTIVPVASVITPNTTEAVETVADEPLKLNIPKYLFISFNNLIRF